ncbi:MAG: DNA mismatch repair protein MutS [Oscillospiraceae bacterium]|nr:DNA mismatch repair protein MutS [Oscillospiraceae bacterium]
MAELSPMMRQYREIKENHGDHILMFRLGDFYEMFFEDARTVSKELELTLTARDCGLPERAPMCGVPYHSVDAYIARLVKKGYKIAICDQMENPAEAKGIVRREVTRVITPGTVTDGAMLDESKNNYIAVATLVGRTAGIAFAETSTGQAYVTQVSSGEISLAILNELARFTPSELLIYTGDDRQFRGLKTMITEKLPTCRMISRVEEEQMPDLQSAKSLIKAQFEHSVEAFAMDTQVEACRALGCLLAYILQTQKEGAHRLSHLTPYSDTQFMLLDLTARKNLELTETLRGERRGSLLWVLDKTHTPMGRRLLRRSIEQPLVSCLEITKRQTAVGALKSDGMGRSEAVALLSDMNDLERIMTKLIYRTITPREMRALHFTAAACPGLKAALGRFEGCKYLAELQAQVDDLTDLAELIDRAISPEPPLVMRDGGVIREGYNPQLDEYRRILSGGKNIIAEIEQRERERTGIKNLRVSYNKVFGYYIEVTKSALEQVPEDYIRRQTLVNSERFITPELKELEEKILTAGERSMRLEEALFEELRQTLAENLERIEKTASAIATVDMLVSLAEVAALNGYCCPVVDTGNEIRISGGRHPVVEALLTDAPFVPNDTLLDCGQNNVVILTGPNMAGKSTYMRQVALITLMAQIGSFVPAESAHIGIVDGIYTRVGASDDLSTGQSTFMVEMNEVAHILRSATPKSLLILDEIGRGTSTYDGMSIARAVIEYLAKTKKLSCKTLFATHYHELTALEEEIPSVKNYSIAVKKRGEEITFLRRIVRGGADESFGIEVAKLAGIPSAVVERAREILASLEGAAPQSKKPHPIIHHVDLFGQQEARQLSLEATAGERVADRLRELDLETVTPLEALNLLYELKKTCTND